ncbi:MAG TPA: alpha/beta hydrolase, partial [Vicinamibacterales bacterium]|nr:alpha/beta hydrolase [Vicinamibacterales bacterium]
TIVLHGGDDAFGRQTAAITQAERTTLPRLIDKRIVEGAGHFVPHEKPEAVSAAIVDALNASK